MVGEHEGIRLHAFIVLTITKVQFDNQGILTKVVHNTSQTHYKIPHEPKTKD